MDKHIQAAAEAICEAGEWDEALADFEGREHILATVAVRAWLASVGRSADELDQTVNSLWRSVTDHRPDWAAMGAAATYLSEMAEAIRAVE